MSKKKYVRKPVTSSKPTPPPPPKDDTPPKILATPVEEAPVVMQVSTAKTYIDAFDRTLERYIAYCGVNLHIERKPMVLHQQRLWTALKQGIVNTNMEEIDVYMAHIVNKFYEHKLGVLGEQRLFRYLYNQNTGKTVIDEYAINIYGLLQIACERFSETRPANMVDLNKAVAEAESKVAEKVYAYFNKLGSDPVQPVKKQEPIEQE